MDDVMSHPRMIGQLSEDFFQDRASFLLFGVAGVAWRRVRDYLQGIEKSRFEVVGICRIQVLHGFLIVQCAGSRIQPLRFAIVAGNRCDVLLFPRTLAANQHGSITCLSPELQMGSIRGLPVGMVIARGLAPISHGTVGLAPGHIGESGFGIFVFKGVQHGQTALKAVLGLIRAGDREMDTPVLFRSKRIRVVVLCVRLTEDRRWEAQKRQQETSRLILHSTPRAASIEIGEHARSRYYARVRTRSNVMPDWPLRATRDAAWWRVSVSRLAIVPLYRVRLCPRARDPRNVA